ncbi:hypothetical protein EVAR_28240_1 [Eumeta japonica]|uniref:Uncharacterized protein n=1 Tax=Eumeta variegata TaxID=151549 RepID=A0A4C1V6Q8_EUMVA|nr:hypothetical protein EVAR_28240_1 [Eumeta japonica]
MQKGRYAATAPLTVITPPICIWTRYHPQEKIQRSLGGGSIPLGIASRRKVKRPGSPFNARGSGTSNTPLLEQQSDCGTALGCFDCKRGPGRVAARRNELLSIASLLLITAVRNRSLAGRVTRMWLATLLPCCGTCCARGRPIIVEWERDARHSAGLSLVRDGNLGVMGGIRFVLPYLLQLLRMRSIANICPRDGGRYKNRQMRSELVELHYRLMDTREKRDQLQQDGERF